MYVSHYGFTGRPFQLTPDPQFYFESATHRKAMAYLGYGLAQGEGFIVITGDIGAGKTTLVGHLMATIDPQRLTAVKLAHSQVDGDDLLRLVASAFSIATDGVDKAHVVSRIEAFLHHQARGGRRSLLIVDEAQGLSLDALETLRMLSNFQLGGQSLVQIFLLGQPEFRDAINDSGALEQLRQRIIATHHLEAMQPDEVRPYIEYRLRVVGWNGNPQITPDAFDLLAQASDGVPRRLNALCHRVMERAAHEQSSLVDAALVERVWSDMGAEFMPRRMEAGPADIELGHVVAANDRADLETARADIDALKAGTGLGVAADRLLRAEAKIAQMERRLDEQEEMLRRTLAAVAVLAGDAALSKSFAHQAA
jgi:putative secretion ATPase (PEP-CTERM system associated)